MSLTRDKIFLEIGIERERQENKWGEQNHTPIEWCAILGEEVGEVQKAALESHFCNDPDIESYGYREELIQVAAVAVSMVECLDRNKSESEG